MADIKLKPRMDKPRVLEVNRTPKEAGLILKEHYEARQAQRRPVEKGAVQYATDKVETTGKRSTAFAAYSAARNAKRSKKTAGERKSSRLKQVVYENERVMQADMKVPKMREQLYEQSLNQRYFTYESRQKTVRDSRRRTFTRFNERQGTKTASGSLKASTAIERGRRKAIEDHKARIKTRSMTEKENAALRPLKGIGRQGAQRQALIKQKIDIKTRNVSVRSAFGKHKLMTQTAAAKKARQKFQRKMQKEMLKQAAVKSKKAAEKTSKTAVRMARAAARAIAAAAKTIIAAGGGVVLLVVVLLVAIIAAIAASPFGIFFSGENVASGTVPVSVAVAEINSDFNAKLETLQSGEYDDIVLHGEAVDWPEIIAIFASKVAGADGSDAADVVTIDRTRIDKLKAVFWDMNEISSHVEEIEHNDSDPDDDIDDSWTEYILHITVTAKTATEMATVYSFTPRQTSSANELLANRVMLEELIGNLPIISADAKEVLENLPQDLSAERKAVVRTACSLVGKVNYFLGGLSRVNGWDNRWGQLHKVSAPGSSMTGTYRPYGLDCCGFVDWVFYNVTDGEYIIGHGGGVQGQHNDSIEISWSEAKPGDLVFYPEDSHVGILAGRDESGNPLIIHCAYGYNNVVVTGIEGFTSVARPSYYGE